MASVGATTWLPDTERFFGELSVIITWPQQTPSSIYSRISIIFWLYRTSFSCTGHLLFISDIFAYRLMAYNIHVCTITLNKDIRYFVRKGPSYQ